MRCMKVHEGAAGRLHVSFRTITKENTWAQSSPVSRSRWTGSAFRSSSTRLLLTYATRHATSGSSPPITTSAVTVTWASGCGELLSASFWHQNALPSGSTSSSGRQARKSSGMHSFLRGSKGARSCHFELRHLLQRVLTQWECPGTQGRGRQDRAGTGY